MKKSNNSILKSALAISLFTIFVKVLGLVKQMILSAVYGANIETDAFNISTGIFGSIALLIFSAISVITLTKYVNKKEEEGEESALGFLKTFLLTLICASLILTIVSYLLANKFAELLAPTKDIKYIEILTSYIKIVSFSFIPWCIYLILNVILESEKKFVPGRCQTLFQNLFLIISALLLYDIFGTKSLVYAFLLSGVVECILIYFLSKDKLKKSSLSTKYFFEIKQLLIVSLPLIIGNAAAEINDIIDKKIATNIGEGITTILTYSSTLNEMVTGVLISSFSIVIFSHFSDMVAKNKNDELEKLLKNTVIFLFFILLPLTFIFIFSGENIVKLFYGRGMITHQDIHNIYLILIGYALGFYFQGTRILYAKALYAFQDTKSPMINGFITILINALLSLVLTKEIGIIGISLSTSISVCVATLLFHKSLKKHLSKISYKYEIKEFFKIAFSCILSFGVVIFICNFINSNNIIISIIVSLIYILIYIFLLFVFKSECLNKVIILINKYINKK